MSCQNRKKRPNRTSGSRAITAETGQVGSITPSGRANVSRGGDRAFHIMAGDGYRIFNVLVDGESVGAISHYTFENVRANHTIKVVFKATQPIADPDNTDVSSWLNTRDHTVYLDGFTGGSFAPGRQMTRGQAAQMFYNLLLEKNVSITDTLHRCCAKNSEAKIAEVEQHTSPNPFGGVSPRVLSFGCRPPLTFKESLGPVSGCCKEERR